MKQRKHSLYTLCLSCRCWGINFPNDDVCGNCQSTNTITNEFLSSLFRLWLRLHGKAA
jgi:hypothetical protein